MQSIPDQLYDMAALLPDAIAEGHLISVTRLEVRLSAPLGNLSATLGDDAANQQLNNRRGLLFRQECPPSRCGTRGIGGIQSRLDVAGNCYFVPSAQSTATRPTPRCGGLVVTAPT